MYEPSIRPESILGQPRFEGAAPATVTLTVTPEQAKAILDSQPDAIPGSPRPQRPFRKGNAMAFAYLIRTGRFSTTHQGIAFDLNGVLIDGQHRLAGCVAANLPITVMATFNLPRAAYAAMDRGINRSPSDDVATEGWATGQDATVLAAALKQLHNFDNGAAPWGSVFGRGVDGRRNTLASDEQAETLARHPQVRDVLKFAMQNKAKNIPASIVAFCYTLFRESDPELADAFMNSVALGADLHAGHPALALRNYVQSRIGNGQEPVTRERVTLGILRCWNAYYEGRPMHKVPTSKPRSGEIVPHIAGRRIMPARPSAELRRAGSPA